MHDKLLTTITNTLSQIAGTPLMVTRTERIQGGDINDTYLLHTPDRAFFLKVNSSRHNDMFEKEFNGLQALRNAAAIDIPEPFAYGGDQENIFLLMDYVLPGKPARDFWRSFGEKLAALHQNTSETFGFTEDNYIGSLHQSNPRTTNWETFYASHRIMPLMKQALTLGRCSKEDLRRAENLCSRFRDLFPKEPPALLHGDLWSGNFMVNTQGQPVIYDPAVYYGHREMDIAMTLLFGGFDSNFYEHYNAAFPLVTGWRERTLLYQLYPLLVHLVLFGGHYYHNVMDIIHRYG